MRVPQLLLSISLLFFFTASPTKSWADVPSTFYAEIEYGDKVYYISTYQLNFAKTYLLPSDTSAYRINESQRLQSTFSKENLNAYIDFISVFENLIYLPKSRVYPNHNSHEKDWITPADIVPGFPIGNLSQAKILRIINGGSVDEWCSSPLTRNESYWLDEYPLEIVLQEAVDHFNSLVHIDYTFIGIKGGLSISEKDYFTKKIMAIDIQSDEDIRKIIIEIYEYNVIVIEYSSF